MTRDDRKVRADEADFERYVHAARMALFFSVHLLLGVLRQEKSIAASVLAQHGVTVDGVRDEVARRGQ